MFSIIEQINSMCHRALELRVHMICHSTMYWSAKYRHPAHGVSILRYSSFIFYIKGEKGIFECLNKLSAHLVIQHQMLHCQVCWQLITQKWLTILHILGFVAL